MARDSSSDSIARRLFILSSLMVVFGWGVVSDHYGFFPVPWLKTAHAAVTELLEDTGAQLPWYYVRSTSTAPVSVRDSAAMQPGLTLVAGVAENDRNLVRIVDQEGHVVYRWVLDWFKIWPDPSHVPADARPKSNGGLVHGVLLMPDGDIVFNFEELGMVRMDPCGGVRWKLPYRTHHAINMDNEGNLWAPVLHERTEPVDALPNYDPPFSDYSLLRVSPEGKVLEEVSVFDILQKSGLQGLLYLSSLSNRTTNVSGDTMHLNDVEIFPASLAPGVFEPGDVMISLRNINAIVVFDPSDWRIKFESIGRVLRQHDPDFEDGNTISVFDNHNLADTADWKGDLSPHPHGVFSRIVDLDAVSGKASIEYGGGPDQEFFTDIMGEHQRLANGNLLIAESISGRVFEVDRSGRMVWEYHNIISEGVLGLVSDAQRLPVAYDEQFFSSLASVCGDTN